MEALCDLDKLRREMESDEGRRKRVYKCPAGKLTIGIGHNCEGKDLSNRAIDVIFEDDAADAIKDLDAMWIGWRELSEPRRRALINWSFQLGYPGMRQFVRFWRAIREHDFGTAAAELRDSLWWQQTQPSRRDRVVSQIHNG